MACGSCGGHERLTWAARRYETERQTAGDIHRHLPTLKNLAVTTSQEVDEPLTIIELGVRKATSTSAWLHGLEQSRHGGHLYAVDLVDPPAAVRGHKQVTFIKGDDVSDTVLGRLPETAHIVFVDSSHEHQHTVDEIVAYSSRLLPGGAMVFHDTAVAKFPHHKTTQPLFPVATAVSEWVQALRDVGREPVVREWTRNNGLMIVWP